MHLDYVASWLSLNVLEADSDEPESANTWEERDAGCQLV